MLTRVIYYSQLNLTRGADASKQVQDILTVSQRNNDLNGITGALLLTSRGFIQVLEGYRREIGDTVTRICRDDRHCDIRFVTLGAAKSRLFKDWSMGFIDLSEHRELVRRHSPSNDLDLDMMNPSQILHFLNELVASDPKLRTHLP